MSTAVIINVDDNEPARYARSRLLHKAGFAVHDAGTGGEALRLIAEVQPDIVLLDVNLPDLNGIEVCRRIKTNEVSAGVTVLQISASATTAPHATAALNAGADSFLVEPVDPDVLIATVRAFLRLRTAERALATANQELLEKNTLLLHVNQALRRSNDDLEHFAYIASHDLQEPLRTITTHLQLLERDSAPRFNDMEKQLFSTVVGAALRMSMLIRDVLAYSGIGRESPPLKPTGLNEAVAWAVENLSESIAACDGVVESDDLPAVSGDALQLSQVFQNLIGNSIKYRTVGTPLRVRISARRDSPDEWTICVRDNGIGIVEQHREKVFQPFKRLHGHDIPGNGIGLALCRRIIEGHGGRIWAESAEGEGVTFCFTLRAADAAQASI